jgi:ElaB/YqjD/DUF883 family membrane-anchored ribosome-binding protein
MVNEMASKTEDSAVDIAADLANLRSDVAKLSASMAELLRQQTMQTQDRVRGVVDSAREHLAHSAADAKESVRSASAELEASIERNPVTAVMIAMMCGLVLGLMGRGHR